MTMTFERCTLHNNKLLFRRRRRHRHRQGLSLHCANGDGPFERQNGCRTHPARHRYNNDKSLIMTVSERVNKP